MKHLILLLISLSILGCSNPKKQKKELATTPKKSISTDNKQLIIGTWSSVQKITDRGAFQFVDSFNLNFYRTRKFNSFFKPKNTKTGYWSVISDTILELSMKAVDHYQIEKLTQETLIIKPINFGLDASYVFKKQLTPK